VQAPAERARAKFVAGATLADIQAANPRAIKRSTIVAYIAAAAAKHPDDVDFARLTDEAGLTYDAAAAIASGNLPQPTSCPQDLLHSDGLPCAFHARSDVW
jgi:hypothetical protein